MEKIDPDRFVKSFDCDELPIEGKLVHQFVESNDKVWVAGVVTGSKKIEWPDAVTLRECEYNMRLNRRVREIPRSVDILDDGIFAALRCEQRAQNEKGTYCGHETYLFHCLASF
ncbi:MAG TPA: hypothetical protein VGR15_04235 [Bacteroidota bacterium]|nr:hypothetical protein [Bacteroidota bacterium]